MAMAYKTPGVYVKEISLFPPSVAEVATAIPAFIGHTEKAERRGRDLSGTPTRITSLLEYEQYFGRGYIPSGSDITVKLDDANNYAVDSITVSKRFHLYDSMRLFFANGGGACYVVSAGKYSDTVAYGDEVAGTGLIGALKAVEKFDEPTIVVMPDAPLLTSESQMYTLQQQALAQCGRLQDRVAIFDMKENMAAVAWRDCIAKFRDGIGINNLKYGAAYTPWLYTTYLPAIDYTLLRSNLKKKSAPAVTIDPEKLTSDPTINDLVLRANKAFDDRGKITATINTLRNTSPTIKDRWAALKLALDAAANGAPAKTAFTALVDLVKEMALGVAGWKSGAQAVVGANLRKDVDAYATADFKTAIEGLIKFEKNTDVQGLTGRADAAVHAAYAGLTGTGWLSGAVSAVTASAADYGDPAADAKDSAGKALVDLTALFNTIHKFIDSISTAAATHADLAQSTLYNGHPIISSVVAQLQLELSRVPPCGAIAGVYAYVDSTRGVWKAPANVSLSAVSGPVEQIDFYEQEDLNVDVNAGKSVNAIRVFTGFGTMVWGARTLAGNDNEWRYVPVRRFFNMVEESVKKSTSWAVFEPNDASLWAKVRGMIENYLIQKWRDGALAGATPADAFFVRVGLGQTMTAQDILEGRLNVEIGMAVVRPAEFIILSFSHLMQKS